MNILLMLCCSLLHSAEMSKEEFSRIIASPKSLGIVSELSHYKCTDNIKISVKTTNGNGNEEKTDFSGKQWYVEGKFVVQEVMVKNLIDYTIIYLDDAGQYRLIGYGKNMTTSGVGVKMNNYSSWAFKYSDGIDKINGIEIERRVEDGIEWENTIFVNDKYTSKILGSLKYK